MCDWSPKITAFLKIDINLPERKIFSQTNKSFSKEKKNRSPNLEQMRQWQTSVGSFLFYLPSWGKVDLNSKKFKQPESLEKTYPQRKSKLQKGRGGDVKLEAELN